MNKASSLTEKHLTILMKTKIGVAALMALAIPVPAILVGLEAVKLTEKFISDNQGIMAAVGMVISYGIVAASRKAVIATGIFDSISRDLTFVNETEIVVIAERRRKP